MKKTQLIFDDEDYDFPQIQPSNQRNIKIPRLDAQINQNIFKLPTNTSTYNRDTKAQQSLIQRQQFIKPLNKQTNYSQYITYGNNHNAYLTSNYEKYPNNIPSSQQFTKYNNNQPMYQSMAKPQMFNQPKNVPKLKNKIKMLSHQVVTEAPFETKLLSSNCKYDIPNIAPPRVNYSIQENNNSHQCQTSSYLISPPPPPPPPPVNFNTRTNKYRNQPEYNSRLTTQNYSQIQTSLIHSSIINKKKMQQFEVLKLQTLSFSENNSWIKFQNDKRFYWMNSKNVPLQIKIMLRQLMIQSKQIKLAHFENQAPVSQPLHISSRFNQYKDSMLNQIKALSKAFPVFRKVKDDGNCLYRAFIFNFLQMALTHKSSLYFLKFMFLISNPLKVSFETNYQKITQNNNLSNQNMRSLVLHRLLILYSYRVTLAQQNDEKWELKIVNLFEKTFNQNPYYFDVFLIIGVKNMIAALFKDNPQSFSNNQKISEINKYGYYYDQTQQLLNILSDSFNISICLYQQKRGKLEYNQFGKNSTNKIFIYSRKYHFEILYPEKIVYECIKAK